MKKSIPISIIVLLLIACGESPKKSAQEQKENTDNTTQKKEESGKPLPSGDYSSLLIDYQCDITATELANVFNIPEADVSVTEYQRPGRCGFNIKGFGKNSLGDNTIIAWFLENPGKAQVKKEIQSYLKDQANNESVLGMGIELSETGDSYIVKIPHSGRIVIMNENYDSWLFFNYSQKGIYKSRTEEQHAALTKKTIVLANYLLKKHKR